MSNEGNDALRTALNQQVELQRYLIAKSWEDEAFKQELLADPKATLAKELEQELPDNVKVQVIEEDADTIYILIPKKPNQPEVDEELSEEALNSVAGGTSYVVTVISTGSVLGNMISRLNPSVLNRIRGF